MLASNKACASLQIHQKSLQNLTWKCLHACASLQQACRHLKKYDPYSNMAYISLRQTFWQSFNTFKLKMQPPEGLQDCPSIWPCDLVFDPKLLTFELGRVLIKTNILMKFQYDQVTLFLTITHPNQNSCLQTACHKLTLTISAWRIKHAQAYQYIWTFVASLQVILQACASLPILLYMGKVYKNHYFKMAYFYHNMLGFKLNDTKQRIWISGKLFFFLIESLNIGITICPKL